MFMTHSYYIAPCTSQHNNYYVLFIFKSSSFVYLKDKYKKNRNIINSRYYGEMPNVT